MKSGRAAEDILKEALEIVAQTSCNRKQLQLSPHAIYSTSAELLRLAAKVSREKDWVVTTHVSESEPEFDMVHFRKGPLFDWLKNQRDVSDCGGLSPIQQLENCGVLSPHFLAVHVNYLAESDAELLAKRGSSVVHCPRSHAYFSHRAFPFETLSRAGVNICLGTDSMATVITTRRQPVELNMFAEMRRFAEVQPNVAPSQILEMTTVNGAKALRMSGQTGELTANANADIISIPFSGNISDVHNAVLQHTGPILASMIDGEWAFRST